MTQKRKFAKIAIKDLEIVYVTFGLASIMGFDIEALVLIICVLLETGATICGDISKEPCWGGCSNG